MNLLIPFTTAEEERLIAAARRSGVVPGEFIKRLTLERLPSLSAYPEANLDAKLRLWQEQDGTSLLPEVSTRTLFAQWAEEDARMTAEEREAEDRLWEGVERGLDENRGLLFRRLAG